MKILFKSEKKFTDFDYRESNTLREIFKLEKGDPLFEKFNQNSPVTLEYVFNFEHKHSGEFKSDKPLVAKTSFWSAKYVFPENIFKEIMQNCDFSILTERDIFRYSMNNLKTSKTSTDIIRKEPPATPQKSI